MMNPIRKVWRSLSGCAAALLLLGATIAAGAVAVVDWRFGRKRGTK